MRNISWFHWVSTKKRRRNNFPTILQTSQANFFHFRSTFPSRWICTLLVRSFFFVSLNRKRWSVICCFHFQFSISVSSFSKPFHWLCENGWTATIGHPDWRASSRHGKQAPVLDLPDWSGQRTSLPPLLQNLLQPVSRNGLQSIQRQSLSTLQVITVIIFLDCCFAEGMGEKICSREK